MPRGINMFHIMYSHYMAHHFFTGSITKKELSIIMKSWGLNPTKQDVQDIMNDIDDSGDGEFDFPEFIEIMATRMKVKDH